MYPTSHYPRYMDLINVMTYDLRGSWDGFTGEDSPLFSGPNDKGDYKYFSVVSEDLGQSALMDIFNQVLRSLAKE